MLRRNCRRDFCAKHENPKTADAKMSALCLIPDNRILYLNSIVCVHPVAVNRNNGTGEDAGKVKIFLTGS